MLISKIISSTNQVYNYYSKHYQLRILAYTRGGATAYYGCQLTTMEFRKLSVKYCLNSGSKINDISKIRV